MNSTIKSLIGKGALYEGRMIMIKITRFTKSPLIHLALLLLGLNVSLFPCTVAVISGKATPDGRCLLWKNRDTRSVANKMAYLKGEKFGFITLIDAQDKNLANAWAGINSEGFAIMNSASGDLAESMEGMIDNGRFMKEALGKCADVPDFERFLLETNNKRRVGANYGVIDSQGNACIFETTSASFVKFDANDVRHAPQGYIIRTNYAFTAPRQNAGGGYIRFERASELFETARAERRLGYRFILREASRDLVNEKLHSHPLLAPNTYDPSSPLYINTNDTINRNTSVSVVLFHGAPSPEKAWLSTMWVILGQPVCSVAIPLWANSETVPGLLGGEKTSALNDFARALASYLYPDQRGHMSQYLNVSRLLHCGGEGVLKKLYRIEDKVFLETDDILKAWTQKKPAREDIQSFEEKISAWVYESLRTSFPDIKIQE